MVTFWYPKVRVSEDSDFTSVKKRTNSVKRNHQPKTLYPCVANPKKDIPNGN